MTEIKKAAPEEGLLDALASDELEVRVATAMRHIGERAVREPLILRALAAADQLAPGYVIANEAQAGALADLVSQVIDGEKELAVAVKDALRIPKRMELALRGAVEDTRARLLKARQTGNEARVAYQATLRRQAAEAEEKARQAAQEAARRAAAQAAETGDDVPPPAEVAPVEIPKTVAGGTGKMGIQVRIEVEGVFDLQQAPREWLLLDHAAARAGFIAAEKAGWVKRPPPGESIIWNGVRFTAVETAVNRR